MTTVNISLVGVGGQGILLASEVLSRAAMLAGKDVKKTEVHGMAQRGGSVISQIRFGEKVYSPIIPDGEIDFLVSFECSEALRYADFIAENGTAIINNQLISPITVSSGQQPAVEDLPARVEKAFPQRHIFDALKIARDLGNIRVVSVVMVGALSTMLEIEDKIWQQAIEELVPARHLEINKQAFIAGRQAVS